MTISAAEGRSLPSERRVLAVSSGAHVLHDGYTDLLVVFLPLWQAEFALGYAAIGVMRALYVGALALFQIPVAALTTRFGHRAVLGLGTAVAGASFIVAGSSETLAALVVVLLLGGIGASVQHPIASTLVAAAYEGSRSRGALAIYNFAGDVGKMTFPALAALLLTLAPWRPVAAGLGLLGVVAAAAVFLLPSAIASGTRREPVIAHEGSGRGFPLLLAIGVLDSATRMAFITFLPFLLLGKGAAMTSVGIALTTLALGGAAGKLACGWLGARFGVIGAVFLTEGLTAAAIVGLVALPLVPALALLPLIGVALNGTSSVLYGTVPELVRPEHRARAFGIFYTGTIGGGALAPILFGAAGDAVGVVPSMIATAAMILLSLPLAWALAPWLSGGGATTPKQDTRRR
ncbi:MAG: MFS transporter [Rhodospirillales bacterium]|nr:MFS transporter [Rhodospirillales bacterium]